MSGVELDGLTGLETRVRRIVEEVIQGTPLFLVDLDIRGRKGSQVVDVFIDSDEKLDVEELARVSREVGFLLDAEDVMQGHYSLNVSSPGLNRPLSLPRQYRKNVGRTLEVRYRNEDGANVTAIGTLSSVTDNEIELSTDLEGVLRIPYADVVEAKVQLPW
ncbi:MAG TPA: ribosome maturation factor RimP [Rhodothermales bacterium]|nr:ribosome maturation factor RimP [Rhodothermales bacterium]